MLKSVLLGGLIALPLALGAPIKAIALAGGQQSGTTDRDGTNGPNLTAADFGNGQFVAIGNGRWAELDSSGRQVFFFRELSRDPWSVYLRDDSRNTELQLDVHRMMSIIAQNGSPRRDLYALKRVSHDGTKHPGDRRPRATGHFYDRGQEVTGRNAARADFPGGWVALSGGRWIEHGANGAPTFYFDETQRDDWSVYLIDRSRNAGLQLDFHRKVIRFTPSGQPTYDLYQMSDAKVEQRGGGNGWNGGNRGPGGGGGGYAGNQRAIEAGPIWNQADAQAKCTALAQRMGGQWTGGWWTTEQNRQSVCQIQFRP